MSLLQHRHVQGGGSGTPNYRWLLAADGRWHAGDKVGENRPELAEVRRARGWAERAGSGLAYGTTSAFAAESASRTPPRAARPPARSPCIRARLSGCNPS